MTSSKAHLTQDRLENTNPTNNNITCTEEWMKRKQRKQGKQQNTQEIEKQNYLYSIRLAQFTAHQWQKELHIYSFIDFIRSFFED